MFRYLHRRDRNAATKMAAVIADGMRAAAIAAKEVDLESCILYQWAVPSKCMLDNSEYESNNSWLNAATRHQTISCTLAFFDNTEMKGNIECELQ